MLLPNKVTQIPYSKQSLTQEDFDAVLEVMNSSFLTQGPQIDLFEKALAKRFQVKHAIACSSGTAAIHLSYASLGASADSVGIVPAVTFSATANAFRYLGAKVIFCDVNPADGIIDLDSLQRILESLPEEQLDRCNFVSPVSFAGKVAPLKECADLCEKYGMTLVEDASHSPGGWSERETSGDCKWTQAACLSFHPVKHICAGEGGAVLTNLTEVADRCKALRSHGIVRPFDDKHPTPWKYEQVDLGWNYRITDLQAALGRSQLGKLDESINARKRIAKRYDEALSAPPFSERIDRPALTDGHSWHLYVIRFKEEGLRDQAYKFLKGLGIITQIHYTPLYRHPYFAKLVGNLRLPGAEEYFAGCLSIPLFPTLTQIDQDKVISELARFLSKH